MKNGKNALILTLLLLAAIIIGGFLGEFLRGNSLLGFMGQGFEIGMKNPLLIDLKMLKFTLGFVVSVNFASITAMALAVYVYTKL